MKKRSRYYSEIAGKAIRPCETVKDMMGHLGMDIIEFTARMGMSSSKAQRFLAGKVRIDGEMATMLSSAIGCPAHFWLNLEKFYRDKQRSAA